MIRITRRVLVAALTVSAMAGCVRDNANEEDLPDVSQEDMGAEPPAGDDEPTSNARIPAKYAGRWDANAAACARSTNEMRLVVSPEVMQFYEGRGAVSAVRTDGDGISVDLDMQAEGTRFKRTYELSTNAAGDRLTVTTEASSAERVRCPSGI